MNNCWKTLTNTIMRLTTTAMALIIATCVTGWASTRDLGQIRYANLPTVGVDINFTYVLAREDPAALNAWGRGYISTRFNVGTLDYQLITGGTAYNVHWLAVGWTRSGDDPGVECTITEQGAEFPGGTQCRQSLKTAIGYRDLHDLGLDQFIPAGSVDNLMITIAKAIQNNLIDEDTGVFLGASKVADFDRGNFYAALGQQTAKIRLEHKAFALGAVPGTPGTKAYICLDSAEPSGE